ncbi:carbonic anhydrase, partial [Bacillus sp. SIMBA_069]
MSLIDDALTANAALAAEYEPAIPGRPAPKIAILTCADPRLSSLVRLLGLEDADVDLIRNVGTVVDDDSIRSLIVS